MSFGAEDPYAHQPVGEIEDAPTVPEYERHRLSREASGANHENNWTLLLRDRLLDPIIKKRFLEFKKRFPTTETSPRTYFVEAKKRLSLEKPNDVPSDEYEQMIDELHYNDTVDSVFNSTQIGDAFSFNSLPNHLGVSQHWKHEGAVFNDARGAMSLPLDVKGKNIVEMHEKMHGFARGLTNGEKEYIRSIFNTERNRERKKILPSYPLKDQIDEVLTRMSQLKSYFGFSGGEEFTRDHLDFARENYIKDTGLDNNMSEFFDAIDRENEDRFIELMNTVAC